MNPELQTLVDRVELLERQNRGWKTLGTLSLAVAGTALAVVMMPSLSPPPAIPGTPQASGDRARFSVVEANRFLLRSPGGDVSGGLEVDARGTIRLVLGNERTAAAFLEVEHDGAAHLSLRGKDGGTRASLHGGERPALSLAPAGAPATAHLGPGADGTGSLRLTTRSGRMRFHVP